MKNTWHILSSCLSLAFLNTAAEKQTAIPDLTQTDPKGNFARGGKSYCGPVAISNSLMWLYREELKGSGISQYDLVNQLASENYMNTDPFTGTGPNGVMIGVKKFLKNRGLEDDDYSLRFQGWRSHRPEFSTGIKEPQLNWIRETLASGGAVWINLGWYRVNGKNNTYKRVGGHWVTAIETGRPQENQPDPKIVVIHDPSPRAGRSPKRQHVELLPLERGELIGKTRNLPRPATGLFRMGGGMCIKPSVDCAILDGAVALRFK